MKISSKVRVAAALAFLLDGVGSAWAADAQAFANRVKAVAQSQGIEIAFAGAVSEGDDVLVKGLVVGTGPDATAPVDLTFKGVSGSDAEGWTVASVPVADLDKTEGATRVQLKDVGIENLKLAGTGASTLPGGAGLYFESATLGSLVIEEDGKQSLALSGVSLKNAMTDSGGLETEGNFGDIKLDFEAMKSSPEAKATMAELGYTNLGATGSFNASWDPKSGQLSLDPLTVTVENAGSLDFSYQIDGYTPAFMSSLAALRTQMAANPQASETVGMGILGLVSQLSIVSTDLVFTDDSVTTKLLDYYAKQGGQTREQMIDGLVGSLTPMLAALQNPDFQKEVTDAVSAFLKAPKSLAITSQPEKPVSATAIMGAAMAAPQSLPSVLSLSVIANEEE